MSNGVKAATPARRRGRAVATELELTDPKVEQLKQEFSQRRKVN
jgi:hypothetical protein